jgi:ribosomal protein L2
MAIKQYKPTSPGRRGMTGFTFDEVTKKRPERSLLAPKTKKAGRTSDDEITLFKATGLAIQDVGTAFKVYQLARERGIGREI